MSHRITGNDIELTRGDSLLLQLAIRKNGLDYTPSEGSEIRFAMKERYKDPDSYVKILKNIPIDTLRFSINPEDTKKLIMKKTYVYDIQLTDEAGNVDTFIKGNFTIGEEVL